MFSIMVPKSQNDSAQHSNLASFFYLFIVILASPYYNLYRLQLPMTNYLLIFTTRSPIAKEKLVFLKRGQTVDSRPQEREGCPLHAELWGHQTSYTSLIYIKNLENELLFLFYPPKYKSLKWGSPLTNGYFDRFICNLVPISRYLVHITSLSINLPYWWTHLEGKDQGH